MTTVYVRRRFFALWMPMLLLGLAVHVGSYMHSLTFNGLSLLGIVIVGLGIFAAAYDAGES